MSCSNIPPPVIECDDRLVPHYRMSQLEYAIRKETEKRLFKAASTGVSDPNLGEAIRLQVAVEVCREFVKMAQRKTIDYCQALKRNDGYIPWSDVKRYNQEWLNENL
jgi:hypothetical protein